MPLPMFLSLVFICNTESKDDKNDKVFDDKVVDDGWVDPSENVSIIGQSMTYLVTVSDDIISGRWRCWWPD